MYTGALENYPELVDQMAWIAPLLGNPGDVLARVRSPWELAESLRGAGLLFPETRSLAEGLPADCGWLAKTYNGASGSGVREWNRELGAGSGEGIESGQVCFQKRINGVPCAAVYVAADAEATLLGVTRQLIGEPWLRSHGFQYSGSIGPWPVSEVTRATLVRLGSVLSEQFELAGLFGVDFILDGEQVWTVEANPRYTASVEIVERFTGMSAIAAHVAACGGPPSASIGAEDGPARVESPCHGKATLFADRDIVISQAFADYSIAESLRQPWPTLGDVSAVGTPVENGRPVLTVFAAGANVAEVEQQLRERAVELEQKLYID